MPELPDTYKMSVLQREFLTYLSHAPGQIISRGNDYLPYLALNLGKCLVWVSSQIDDKRFPQKFCHPSDEAKTVWSLGKQLCDVGIKLQNEPLSQAGTIHAEMRKLREQHERIELLLSRCEPNGGAN